MTLHFQVRPFERFVIDEPTQTPIRGRIERGQYVVTIGRECDGVPWWLDTHREW